MRPGSLGPQRAGNIASDDDFRGMIFDDFEVRRGKAPGEFIAVLTVRRLKTDGFQRANKTGYMSSRVKYHFQSPQNAFNLMFSIPHRLLVLALRRGALRDHTTIESLLDGHDQYIDFKTEFLQKPVLVKGTQRGLSILADEPLTSEAITEYIRLRAEKAGFPGKTTAYCMRRAAATDFIKVLGKDLARDLMNHDVDSRCMEVFYQELHSKTDVSAATLGESITARASEMEMDSHHVYLAHLPARKVAELYATELNTVVRQSIATDDEWRDAKTLAARKARERVLRRQALHYLTKEAHDKNRRLLTVEEWRQRKHDFFARATEFNRRLVERIQAPLEEDSTQAGDADEFQDLDFDSEFDESKTRHVECECFLCSPMLHDYVAQSLTSCNADTAEDDLEDTLVDQDSGDDSGVEIHGSEEQSMSKEVAANQSIIFGNVEYKVAVSHMMELLFENGLSEYSTLGKSLCRLCLDDDTIPNGGPEKSKFWTHHHLQRHMEGKMHSQFEQMKRRAIKLQDENDWPGLRCEFCTSLLPSDAEHFHFASMRDLTKHWSESTAEILKRTQGMYNDRPFAKQHHEAMRNAGYYDDESKGGVARRENEREAARKRQRSALALQDSRFAYSDDKELLLPVPIKSHGPLLVHGSFINWTEQADRHPAFRFGDIPEANHQPSYDIDGHSDFLVAGDFPTAASQLALEQNVEENPDLEYVPVPGTVGGMLGQGNRMMDRIAEDDDL